MGWENVFHCEINPFCQQILKHYWPQSISYDDIKTTDFTIHRGRIDILSGGFPCQPYSTAGKRLGKEDDRHLWPEMLRAIREIEPKYIVGENVHGIVNWNGGMVFEEVQTDLEAEGYEVQSVILPACGIGTYHKRERVWFIANSSKKQLNGTQPKNVSKKDKWRRPSEWGKDWFVIELGSRIGGSPTSFHNGVYFEPTIIREDDGISTELDEIEGYGNAVVPGLVFEIFKVIDLMQ